MYGKGLCVVCNRYSFVNCLGVEMSEYGTVIIGKDNGQPPIEITQEMLDASIPLITFIEKELK